MKVKKIDFFLTPFLTKKNLLSVSYRKLNYWDKAEFLLLPARDNEVGWRKFSIAEFIWIKLLNELSTMNISIEPIAALLFRAIGVKKETKDKDAALKFLKKLHPALEQKKHLRLIIKQDEVVFQTYEQWANGFPFQESYISICMNKLISEFATVQLTNGLRNVPFPDQHNEDLREFLHGLDDDLFAWE